MESVDCGLASLLAEVAVDHLRIGLDPVWGGHAPAAAVPSVIEDANVEAQRSVETDPWVVPMRLSEAFEHTRVGAAEHHSSNLNHSRKQQHKIAFILFN